MSKKTVLFLLLLTCFAALAAEHPKVDMRVYDAFGDLSKAQSDDFDGVRVIIHLVDRENLRFDSGSDAAEVADSVTQNQSRFLEALRDDDLLAEGQPFKRLEAGFRPELLLDYQHAIAGYVSDVATLEKIADRSDVTLVEFDQLNKLFTVEGRNVTGSTTAHNSGHRGQGIGVAVIDSNFDLLHSELGGSTTLPNSIVKGGYNFSSNTNQIHSQVFNDCYHGTGTASIVRRYAQSSHLYALVVFPNAFDSVIANAINWCVTNKNGVGGGSPIKIISMSLGGGQYSGTCDTGLMHTAAGTALSNGILVLAASGNDGWASSTASPSCSSNVISVGSTWDANGAAYSPFPPANCSDSTRQVDERTCYSNKSSVLDIYAPSEEVICARCAGGTWALGGTSSACPAAAGMIAQLLSANASYAGNKASVVSRLQSTGVTVIGDTGKRRININAAIGTTTCTPGTTSATSISATTGNWKNYTFAVPACATTVTVGISGGTGDADLYVRRNAAPTTSTYDCRPYLSGNSETCNLTNSAATTYHIGIRAYSTFSGVTMNGSYQ